MGLVLTSNRSVLTSNRSVLIRNRSNKTLLRVTKRPETENDSGVGAANYENAKLRQV